MKQLIKIFVTSRKGKTAKKTFFNYRTRMNLLVKGEEDKGLQVRTVDVKFNQEADIAGKKLGTDYLRGFLYCDPAKVDAPSIYEVKTEINKEGVEVAKYPAVWIKAVDHYEEVAKVANQSAFYIKDDSEEEEADDGEASDLGGSDE